MHSRTCVVWLLSSGVVLLLINHARHAWPTNQLAASSPPASVVPLSAEDALDIFIAADMSHFPGVAGVIRSARAHSHGSRFRFHVATLPEQERAAWRAMECFAACGQHLPASECIRIIPMPTNWLRGRVRVLADPKVTGPLASPLNFARFYLPRLLPRGVRRVLYLDADTIVRGDLRIVWRVALSPGAVAAAVPRHEAHFRYSRYARRCAHLFAERYGGKQLNTSGETFNAGVVLYDLARWEAANLTLEAEWWMGQHLAAPNGLWDLGSQPILHLVLHGRWAALPARWNVDGLGRIAHLNPEVLQTAQLLHWTGRRKPWLRDGLHASMFPLSTSEVKRCDVRA